MANIRLRFAQVSIASNCIALHIDALHIYIYSRNIVLAGAGMIIIRFMCVRVLAARRSDIRKAAVFNGADCRSGDVQEHLWQSADQQHVMRGPYDWGQRRL